MEQHVEKGKSESKEGRNRQGIQALRQTRRKAIDTKASMEMAAVGKRAEVAERA